MERRGAPVWRNLMESTRTVVTTSPNSTLTSRSTSGKGNPGVQTISSPPPVVRFLVFDQECESGLFIGISTCNARKPQIENLQLSTQPSNQGRYDSFVEWCLCVRLSCFNSTVVMV